MKTTAHKRYSIRTHSGIFIHNIDQPIDSKLFKIGDIAHGLSNLCRFSGQTRFYTVAGHSILVSEWVEANGGTPLEALWGLLHDASEAYITDLPMPVKVFCPDYYTVEANLQRAICRKFGLPKKQPEIVTTADQEILRQEMLALFDGKPFPYAGKHPKKAFLARFEELKNARKEK